MIVAWFFAFALSGLVYVIRLIHRALPYAIVGAPLELQPLFSLVLYVL